MQINKNFQEPTFKQIKLSEEELKEAKSYFQKILSFSSAITAKTSQFPLLTRNRQIPLVSTEFRQ